MSDLIDDALTVAEKLSAECKRAQEGWAKANGMLRKSLKQRDDAFALLDEIQEWMQGYVDVNDGDYGKPTPNRAMSLSNEIDALRGRGGY